MLERLIKAQEEHGIDSDEFCRCYTQVKRKFLRETKGILESDNGRGYSVPLTEARKRNLKVMVSNYAIDRASTRILAKWKKYSKKGEGIATWLERVARNWMKLQSKVVGPGIHTAWKGMRFAFAYNGTNAKGYLMFTLTTVVEA